MEPKKKTGPIKRAQRGATMKPAAEKPAVVVAKPRPDRQAALRRALKAAPRFALKRHPSSLSYRLDEWEVMLKALPLLRRWLEGPAGDGTDLLRVELGELTVWETVELDHNVLNIRRDGVLMAVGEAKARLVVASEAEIRAWVRQARGQG